MTTERILGTLAVVGPIAGLVIGTCVGASRKQLVPLAAKGFLIGCLGLVAYGVWTERNWQHHFDRYVRTPDAWKQELPQDMRELIDHDTAEKAVWISTRVVMLLGFIGMFLATFALRSQRAIKLCGFAIACAAAMGLLWSAYNWHCRFDPESGYFGLEKVRVLGVNLAMFMATGVAMGVLWAVMMTKKPAAELLGGSMAERPQPPSHPATQQPNKET